MAGSGYARLTCMPCEIAAAASETHAHMGTARLPTNQKLQLVDGEGRVPVSAASPRRPTRDRRENDVLEKRRTIQGKRRTG